MGQTRETRLPETEPTEIPDDWQLDGDSVRADVADEFQERPEEIAAAWSIVEQASHQDPLLRALLDAHHVLRRIGGIVTIAAIQEQLGPKIFRTVEFAFKWNSYALKREGEPQEPRPDPAIVDEASEPEPVEA